jgi:hypothetical protein
MPGRLVLIERKTSAGWSSYIVPAKRMPVRLERQTGYESFGLIQIRTDHA